MVKVNNYNTETKMLKGFPEIKKNGIISPYGESAPFVYKDKLYRLELHDPSRGINSDDDICALVRERESGKVIAKFGRGCYYYSFYQENDTYYVLGTVRKKDELSGDSIKIFESNDLVNWSEGRILLTNPGWKYYNTSLAKGENGYVLCIEAGAPKEEVGVPFTCFFSFSKDMVNWVLPDASKGYPKDRYIGGPFMKYVDGYFYLITVEELPCQRYSNYIQRTKDFETWEIGKYNPIFHADNEDKKFSPYACDISDEFRKEIETGFISSVSDVDMCDYNGKTIITYNGGNQLGFYYMEEAEYDGTVAEFLKAFFE